MRSGYDDTHQAKKVLKSAESQTVGCLCLKLRNNSSFSADYSPGRRMSILKVTNVMGTYTARTAMAVLMVNGKMSHYRKIDKTTKMWTNLAAFKYKYFRLTHFLRKSGKQHRLKKLTLYVSKISFPRDLSRFRY